MRFEYQHRGSPHVHGVAWLRDAPDIEQVLSHITNQESSNESSSNSTSLQSFLHYVDRTVTTLNPAISPDGSNAADAPLPKTNPHVCN